MFPSATMVLFCVVALKSILFSHVVLAFIPAQPFRNGEKINSLRHDCMLRLSPGHDDSYCHGATFDNASSAGDSKRTTKRKNKYNKKKMRAQKRSQTRSNGTSLLVTDVASQYASGYEGILRGAAMKRSQDHITYLKMLDRHSTLVLNADYQPLNALPLSQYSWQETVKSVFAGKVVVVDVYPNVTIRAVNMNIPLPSVIALTEYVPQPSQTPIFTRKNVFLRDSYTCQYCARHYRIQDLSLDHVIPRCMGGRLEWENAVTCCKKCNGRKGSCLPNNLHSVGMKLIRKPRIPTKYELAAVVGTMTPRRVHPTWTPFLGRLIKPPDESHGEEVKSFVDDLEMM
mmetsp:Transcript_37456/g.44694  ORF Transcript_37456/g.44694 Transcript_37456/m.44694 type:complete len:342 (-) Transcript_37456:291-1316(-)